MAPPTSAPWEAWSNSATPADLSAAQEPALDVVQSLARCRDGVRHVGDGDLFDLGTPRLLDLLVVGELVRTDLRVVHPSQQEQDPRVWVRVVPPAGVDPVGAPPRRVALI